MSGPRETVPDDYMQTMGPPKRPRTAAAEPPALAPTPRAASPAPSGTSPLSGLYDKWPGQGRTDGSSKDDVGGTAPGPPSKPAKAPTPSPSFDPLPANDFKFGGWPSHDDQEEAHAALINPEARGAVLPSIPFPGPVLPPSPIARPARPDPAMIDASRTMPIGLLPSLTAKRSGLLLQFFDRPHWRDLEMIGPDGLVVGRSTFARGMSAPEFVALKHLHIVNENGQLFVEDCGTLNGFYRLVAPGVPARLTPGARFQIGHHIIEFRLPAPSPPPSSLVAPGGEVFWGRSIAPWRISISSAPTTGRRLPSP